MKSVADGNRPKYTEVDIPPYAQPKPIERGQEIIMPILYTKENRFFDFSRYTRHGPQNKIIPLSIMATRRNKKSRLVAAKTMCRPNSRLKIAPKMKILRKSCQVLLISNSKLYILVNCSIILPRNKLNIINLTTTYAYPICLRREFLPLSNGRRYC